MSQIEIADDTLRSLVRRAEAGEEIVLAERGRPIAKLVLAASRQRWPVRLGRLEGQGDVPDDFDAPLPDDLLDMFEGKR